MVLPISGASQATPSTLVDNPVYSIKNSLNKATFPAGSLAAAQQLCCPPILDRIYIQTLPTKTEYEIGEAMDWSGLSVTGTFSDGSTKEYTSASSEVTLDPAAGYTFGEANAARECEFTVKVGSVSKTVSFTVNVKHIVRVTGITTSDPGTTYVVPGVGNSGLAEVYISPSDATDQGFSVDISDRTVVTAPMTGQATQGRGFVLLEGLKPGHTTLTLTSNDGGYTDVHDVTVTA